MVWPVTIQVAGLPPEEIGVVPGGFGPERAIDELALLLHEWADFVMANKRQTLAIGDEIAQSVPAAFRRPTPDPRFEAIEADAIRAAGEAWRKDHPDA